MNKKLFDSLIGELKTSGYSIDLKYRDIYEKLYNEFFNMEILLNKKEGIIDIGKVQDGFHDLCFEILGNRYNEIDLYIIQNNTGGFHYIAVNRNITTIDIVLDKLGYD